MKIYIVEDDLAIANILSNKLQQWGYETVIAESFDDIMVEFKANKPQLVLMDVVLPYYNGFYWCQKIREISNVPLMFISSRGEDMDIVMAMQYGGDDYIVKPINIEVTRVKIQALLRRAYRFAEERDYLEFDGVLLFLTDAKIGKDGETVSLSRTELMILESLFRGNGSIVSRETIMERCWQNNDFIDDNTLAVNMTRLRKKLSEIGISNRIKTKKGRGYYLEGGEDEQI